MNKVQQLVQALISSGGRYHDTHTGEDGVANAFATFVSTNGTEHVVMLYDIPYFTINPFALINGKVYLDRHSIGGDVQVALGDRLHALIEYNKRDKRCRFIALYHGLDPHRGTAQMTIIPEDHP